MPTPQNVRRLALTGAVISITIAGTLYGAGLKTDQQIHQTAQKRREATIDEKILALRTTRAELFAKKDLVERQIRDLEERIEERRLKGLNSAKERPRER